MIEEKKSRKFEGLSYIERLREVKKAIFSTKFSGPGSPIQISENKAKRKNLKK